MNVNIPALVYLRSNRAILEVIFNLKKSKLKRA